jgi:DNA-binding transcriptional MerR regulator
MDFVKIKNLQEAGFTIGEIRLLLKETGEVICAAFDKKIAEQEERLQKTKQIRASYQSEMSKMQETVNKVREQVAIAMAAYDPAGEFGISGEEYARIIENVNDYFENLVISEDSRLEFLDYQEQDSAPTQEEPRIDFLQTRIMNSYTSGTAGPV